MAAALAAVLGFFAYPLVVGAIGLILSILFIIAAEHENEDFDSVHGFAIFFTIVAGLIYCKPILAFLRDWSWQFVLLGIVGYLIIGGINSAFRWFKYCRKFVEKHPAKSIKENIWDNDSSQNRQYRRPTAEEAKKQAEEYYRDNLRPSKHKSRLLGWIAYWPWSVFWNILGDLLTGIYDALSNVYSKISASVIKRALNQQ